MKRSILTISMIMVTVALIGSGCKKNRSSPQGNSSVSNNFSGSQGSTVANQNAPGNNNNLGGANSGDTSRTSQGNVNSNSQASTGTNGTGNVATGASNSGSVNGNSATGNSNGTGSTATSNSNAAVSGTAHGAPTTSTAQVAQAPEAPKEPPVTCFIETFKHKPTPGHDSEEACSHHKNSFKLSHSDINMKSVCVRVNDVPVKFDRIGHGNEFLIGSIAGPQAIISVQYCIGKNTCATSKKDDCAVPKDEFLDAIGGGDTEDGAVAKWDNGDNTGDQKLNNDVKRELADIDDTATDNHGANNAIFKDWIEDKPVAPACTIDKKHSS